MIIRKYYTIEFTKKENIVQNETNENKTYVETQYSDLGEQITYNTFSAVSKEIHRLKKLNPTMMFRYALIKIYESEGRWR